MKDIPGLLATDLDGTLAVNGRISLPSREAAAALRAAGIPVLIITGRNLRSFRRVAGIWDVADAVLFSSGAGTQSGPGGEPREHHRLTAFQTSEIVSILDRFGEDYCILDPVPGSHHFAWRRHRPAAENPDFDARMAIYSEWARPWTGTCGDACQVLVIRPPGLPMDPELEAALAGWSVFHSSSPLDHSSMWLEIFPGGMNKGRALADWCADAGIPPEQVLALGNDHNDRSMLDLAGHPRVVANAPEALKGAYPVLPSAAEGGFIAAAEEALKLFG